MLRTLRLENYRGFDTFRITFTDKSLLIGPNNAGKSSILTVLRVADNLIRFARARNPVDWREDEDRKIVAYPVSLNEYPALAESIRYEFYGDQDVRVQIEWKSGAILTAIWPQTEDGYDPEPFFYLETLKGIQPRTLGAVRNHFAHLGVIPILTPIEHRESLRDNLYVRRNVASRLASRHFRNQLRLLKEDGEWDEFLEFSEPWLYGFDLERAPDLSLAAEDALDIFYFEKGSRIPKELTWAGDGMQVWLQIFYHIFRVRGCETLILDEPEVYLHPDLQRRLIQLLDSTGKQIILATHSSEIAAEAEPHDLVLVDKQKRAGVRARSVEIEGQIGAALGSQFNLKLAKALRSRSVVFVEGDDLGLLRPICRNLGMSNLASERGVSIISLGGFSMWVHVEAFDWLVKKLLPDAIQTFVLLDRDYRSDAVIENLEQTLHSKGVVAHVWQRKELESYLLTPQIVARATKLPVERIDQTLAAVADDLETEVFGCLVAERIQEIGGGSQNHSRASSSVKREFDAMWRDAEARLRVIPPKSLLSGLNRRLQEAGDKAVSFRALASSARPHDLPLEFIDALRAIEDSLG